MDFYSILLARKLKKESGGDVTIESLVVTENGNYSETGKAYSPVVVNVPFPENGYLLESESGQAINITDGAPLYLQECKAKIESVQEGSGDPSPTNIRPIRGQAEVNVARCGKNLFDKNNIRGYGWIHGATGAFVDTDTNFISSNYINVSNWGGKQITINKRPSGANPGVAFYDANKTFVSGLSNNNATQGTPWTVTVPTNAVYMAFCSRSEYLDELQLEHGDAATEYEAYNGKTYTIQLGETIYGGELDVLTGELTVTHESVDLGNLSWAYDGANIQRFWATLNGMKSVSAWNGIGFLCSNYSNGVPDVDGSGGDKIIGVNSSEIYIRDTSYTDAATFKNALQNSNAQLVYELATPITIPITPTLIELLQGTNTISADDDLTIKYFGKGVNA